MARGRSEPCLGLSLAEGTALVMFEEEDRWFILTSSGQVLVRDRFAGLFTTADGRQGVVDGDGTSVLADAHGTIAPYQPAARVERLRE